MFTSSATLDNSLTQGLACAAIHSGLQGILIFDAPYSDLQLYASILSTMLKMTRGQEVKQIILDTAEYEDDLWGSAIPFMDQGNPFVLRYQGLLVGPPYNVRTRLVVIPDLTRLSLSAARACVMLVGADIVHLERHGQHKAWRPDFYWLAGCSSKEVGAVSPHLLDRFAVRLRWQTPAPSQNQTERAAVLRTWDLNHVSERSHTGMTLPSNIKEQIQRARTIRAVPTDEAIEQVFQYTYDIGTSRRDIALLRLALSYAQLHGESQVMAAHVDAAADLIGLRPTMQQETHAEQLQPDSPQKTSQAADHEMESSFHVDTIGQPTTSLQPASEDAGEPVYEPDQSESGTSITLLTGPYPEDIAPIEREAASLQLPPLHYATRSADRGTVIGVERATALRDLSIIDTIFAAMPFQHIRKKGAQSDKDDQRLFFSKSDLRKYLREPGAEYLLLLLLDYTSLSHCDWRQALAPYLGWAYEERASICIVQVGASNPKHYLRAEMIHERSILVPAISLALDEQRVEARSEKRKRATPLAHGLDLSLQAIRHATQHGRSRSQQVLFLVISDGRGNVPLEASRSGRLTKPVAREGIEDALNLAQQLRVLRMVQSIFLNPQPAYYPDLPPTLAAALGAELINIPSREVGGMER